MMTYPTNIHARGFTLIETIIYIALLGILMSGAILTAFDLVQSGQSSNTKATLQEEGNFVQRKLAWALSDMSVVPATTGSCTQTFTVNKTNYGSNPVTFRLNGSVVQMSENGGAYIALTTANVSASCLKFQAATECGALQGITATLTLNGLDFSTTKCIRK